MIGGHPPGTDRYEIHRLLDAVLDKIEGKTHGLLSDTPGKREPSDIFKADPDFDSFVTLAKRLGLPLRKSRDIASKRTKGDFENYVIGLAAVKLGRECKSQLEADTRVAEMANKSADAIVKIRNRMSEEHLLQAASPITRFERYLFTKEGFEIVRQFTAGTL